MKLAEEEIARRKEEAEVKKEKEKKKLKIATPGQVEPKTPRTPSVRSRYGL